MYQDRQSIAYYLPDVDIFRLCIRQSRLLTGGFVVLCVYAPAASAAETQEDGISPSRSRLTWILLYTKPFPVLIICSVVGTAETDIGILNDWLTTSLDVWNVCCVAAPVTATPLSCGTVETLSGKFTLLPGAKLPLNESVYTPGWLMVISGLLLLWLTAVPYTRALRSKIRAVLPAPVCGGVEYADSS